MINILNINEIRAENRERVGEKAYNISRLLNFGYRVCSGYILSVDYFTHFVKYNNINEKHITSLSDQIMSGSFSTDQLTELKWIYTELLNGSDRLIARSSATDEDGFEKTYAGIFKSITDICTFEELIIAIKKIWCSAFASKAMNYSGNIRSSSGMAVLIQQMLDCDKSGVIFTINPVSYKQEIVLEAVKKNNFKMIANKEIAQRYYIDKHSDDISYIKDNSLLNEIEIKDLYKLSIKAEKDFGFPCDIEWGMINGEIYVFQIRPVVRVYKPDQYFKSVIKDTDCILLDRFAEPASVCYLSFLDKWQEMVYLSYFNEKPGNQFNEKPLCFINNRVYWNVKYQKKYFEADTSNNHHKKNLLKELIRQSYKNWYTRLDEYDRNIIRFKRQLKTQSHSENLIALLDQVVYNFCYFIGIDHYRFLGFAQIMYKETQKRLSKNKLNKEAADKLMGMQSNINYTINANKELLAIVRQIQNNSRYFWLINEKDSDYILEQIFCNEKYSYLKGAIAEFLIKHGHRSTYCDDIYYPHWEENPMQVIDLLKQLIKVKDHLDKKLEKEEQQDILTIYDQGNISSIEAMSLEEVIYLTGKYMKLREDQRYYFDKSWILIRQILLKIAKNLVDLKKLEERQDIFHMTIDEINEAIFYTSQSIPQDIINMRKELFKKAKKEKPEYIIKGSDPVPVQKEGSYLSYKVMGIAPGVATGKIVIINSLNDLSKIAPGTIGVVRTFHPSWTPVLEITSGLIMSYGNMLSHGAVVAREYGIPVVVFNDDATAVFNEGDTVQISGTSGRINILG